MRAQLSAVLRELTPPVAWRALRSVSAAVRTPSASGGSEKDAAWYDQAFNDVPAYQAHYRQTHYYFLWCVVVDRIMRSGATSVLDIGCGPGQVARFLADKGLTHYHGIDLSPTAIKLAEALCPDFSFRVASALDDDGCLREPYDTAISLEFLEHVVEDIAVLKRLNSGTRFIGTVPSFEYESHVRFFSDCEEVAERYGQLFDAFSVDVFVSPIDAGRFFLMDGVRR